MHRKTSKGEAAVRNVPSIAEATVNNVVCVFRALEIRAQQRSSFSPLLIGAANGGLSIAANAHPPYFGLAATLGSHSIDGTSLVELTDAELLSEFNLFDVTERRQVLRWIDAMKHFDECSVRAVDAYNETVATGGSASVTDRRRSVAGGPRTASSGAEVNEGEASSAAHSEAGEDDGDNYGLPRKEDFTFVEKCLEPLRDEWAHEKNVVIEEQRASRVAVPLRTWSPKAGVLSSRPAWIDSCVFL